MPFVISLDVLLFPSQKNWFLHPNPKKMNDLITGFFICFIFSMPLVKISFNSSACDGIYSVPPILIFPVLNCPHASYSSKDTMPLNLQNVSLSSSNSLFFTM